MTRRRYIESLGVRVCLRIATAFVLVFLYVPLIVIVLYAFNSARAQGWPIDEYSTK